MMAIKINKDQTYDRERKYWEPSIIKMQSNTLKYLNLSFSFSLFPFKGRVVQTGGQEYKYII